MRPTRPRTPSGIIQARTHAEAAGSDATQKVLEYHSDLTTPDLRDLSPDPLTGLYAAFALLADHANKADVLSLPLTNKPSPID